MWSLWVGHDFIFTFHFRALEKEMATHSSVLAWRIPGTGEPGGLPSMGSHRVGQGCSDLAAAAMPSRFIQSCEWQDFLLYDWIIFYYTYTHTTFSFFFFFSHFQVFESCLYCASGCTSLQSHQQCARAPFSSHPQHHLSLVFLMLVLTGENWFSILWFDLHFSND